MEENSDINLEVQTTKFFRKLAYVYLVLLILSICGFIYSFLVLKNVFASFVAKILGGFIL